ncbi:hypothetical protein [Nonomuraea basaltis]|uniref:hypothetical protein n=1 Tax=Nonomuraea basaltis TaxID=2495887 RepID=UPI00110C57FE|nr:hypothetical protein [Nonomuraea basaltis]TMR99517.1 hypothetical protein EJK15_06810 [Nonomuraea basaltis]
MSWIYHNSNTGQTVTLPERDLILECWPNWVILSRPTDPVAPAVPSGPEPAVAQAPAGPAPVLPPGPPPEGANKATWVIYAVSRGMAEKDARALSKAALIEEFGQEESDG